MKTFLLSISILCLFPAFASAQGEVGQTSSANVWPQFRGPNATGVVPDNADLPEAWSAEENVEWKRDVPGRGWSSPVVWKDKVFFTTAINLGESEQIKKGLYFGGDRPEPPKSDHQWVVFCLNLADGNVLWQKTVHEGMPQTSIHLKSSYASETPVIDGRHVYVLFGGLGIYCLNFDGDIVWSKPLTPSKTRYGWGYAASPVLHGDRLYVVNDNEEESYLLALDKLTGEQIWRVDRPDEKSNWATPYVWQHDGRTEIVTPGTGKVRSYGLDGKELWSFGGMSSITIATPYAYQGNLIVSSGYVGDKQRPLYAIRPGARGDISLAKDETSNDWIAWSQPQGAPYNPSTLTRDGIVHVLLDFGFFMTYDAQTGEPVYSKQRIPNGRAFTTSPWSYNGKVFCLNEDGVTFVIKVGREFEILGTNRLADDDMGMASPAIVGDRLLLRSSARIYSIRKDGR